MIPVSFVLAVDGANVSPEVLAAIQEIAVEDHVDLAAMLRLRLAMAAKETADGWSFVDDAVFPRLAKLKLAVTVGTGSAQTLFEGHVVHTNARFSSEPGEGSLNVVAMDPSVLMHLEEKVKAWPDMADADIASAIFSDHGLTPKVEATEPTREALKHTTIQRGSDIHFLRQLAVRNGYECYVEANPSSGAVEGHFHPPQLDADPQGTLTVNLPPATNVKDFTARFSMLRPATAKAAGVDIADASPQNGEAQSAALEVLGAEPALPGDRPRQVLLSDTGLALTGELQTYAQAVVDRSAWAVVAEGELETPVFGALLRAKRPVLVRGAGKRFSGEYYVERVLHTMAGGGYTQKFTLRRNAVGMTSSEPFAQQETAA